MTLILGFQAMNGIVLCADSLEDDGITKKRVRKIRTCSFGEWGYGIMCAGDGDLGDTFTAALPETLNAAEFDPEKILMKVRLAISSTRKRYPNSQFGMLFALHSKQSLVHPRPACDLFRNLDGSEHLGPVSTFQAIGAGAHLAHFLLSNLYDARMSIEDLERLGTFVVSQAIEHAAGCEGPIQVLTYRIGEWQWRPVKRAEIEEIASKYTVEGLRIALRDYWKSQEPLSVRSQ